MIFGDTNDPAATTKNNTNIAAIADNSVDNNEDGSNDTHVDSTAPGSPKGGATRARKAIGWLVDYDTCRLSEEKTLTIMLLTNQTRCHLKKL